MKEYIEKAAIHELVKRIPKYEMFNYARTEALLGINPDDVDFGVDKIPAADVVEVRHGKLKNGWNVVYDTCTACESEIYLVMEMNYCPICGVKWDKEDTDEIQE